MVKLRKLILSKEPIVASHRHGKEGLMHVMAVFRFKLGSDILGVKAANEHINLTW